MGTNANTLAPLGEVVFNSTDTTVFVLSANNGIGKYSVKLAPPSVAITQRIPFVPQAGENDTVFFNINSMKPVSNSKLTYFGHKTSVSDQNATDSADVSLTLVSGSQYKAVVPGSVNRNGRRIQFRAEVTDVAGVKATVSVPGYFAGVTRLAYNGGPREVDVVDDLDVDEAAAAQAKEHRVDAHVGLLQIGALDADPVDMAVAARLLMDGPGRAGVRRIDALDVL